MNKTSILIGALVALAFAHTAVGYGGQTCTPEPQHLWVLPGTVSVTDNTGLGVFYTATGLDLSEVAGGVVGTVDPTLGETVDQTVDGLGDPTDPPVPTNTLFIGVTSVTDTNVLGDCNGDGTPGDYDGDLDVGIGGFVFGSGTTWEALCAYGHNVHPTSGVTEDLADLPYQVNIGIDDPNGPTPPVFDPATGQEIQGCQTDGVIAANPGGGPSPDGDCLDTWNGNGPYGPVCGGGIGGDDLYWGFIQCSVSTGTVTIGGSPPVQVSGPSGTCSIAGVATVAF